MRRSLLLSACLLSASCKKTRPKNPAAGGPRPGAGVEEATVQAVDEAFARCHRWAEEDGKSEAEKDCPVAVRKALDAWSLYPGDSRLAAILVQLADHLGKEHGGETLASDPARVQRFCEVSRAYFKALFQASKVPNPYFQSLCPKQASRTYAP